MIVLLNVGAEGGGKKLQIFLHRKVLIERKAPGHISYYFSDFLIVTHHIERIDAALSGIAEQQCGHNAKERTLTGSVGPDKTEYLALIYAQSHAFERFYLAVALGYVIQTQHRHTSLSLWFHR